MYSQRAEKQLPMKWYPRLKLYKASNVTFNPITKIAHSYQWWEFIKPIKGKLVYNNYYYSSSTRKHQNKVERLLSALNIKIDLAIEAPMGLQDLERALNHYYEKIDKLNIAILKPRSHKNKNNERQQLINLYCDQIRKIKKLKR